MTLSEKLADMFVKAAHEKKAAAEAPPRVFDVEDVAGAIGTGKEGLRSEFEESLRREEVLRQKAEDYARLAANRSTSQGGAVSEFLKRMLPLPYSAGEAAWRLPAIGAGGVAGYLGGEALAKRRGAGMANPGEVARVLRLAEGGRPSALEAQMIGDAYPSKDRPLPGIGNIQTKKLREVPLKQMAEILGKGKLGPDAVRALESLGVQDISRKGLQEAYLKAVAQTGKEAVPPFVTPSRGARWGGAAAGAGLASILTGLPMAIRAGTLRRTGGELAHKARERVSQAVEKAEREQFRRENILRVMEGQPPLPLSEWKARRKQMRSDWREAIGDYSDLVKARRAGEKKHGAPVPAEGEEG